MIIVLSPEGAKACSLGLQPPGKTNTFLSPEGAIQCHSKKRYQQNAQQKQYRYLLQFQYVIKQHAIIIHIYHNLDA